MSGPGGTDDNGTGSPQDRYYQRYSATTGPIGKDPEGPRKNSTLWIVLGAAFVAVIVAVVAGIVVSGVGRSSGEAAPSSTTSSSTSTETSSPSSAAATSTIPGALNVRPTVPGWQAVGGLINKDNTIKAAYDAPPNWTVKQSNNITFESAKGSGIFGRHTDWGLAAYGIGKCAGHSRATQASASFIDIGKRDPAEAINGIVPDFGSVASLNKDKTTHAKQGDLTSKSITLADGTPAVQGDLTVTQGTLNDDCGTGKSMAFHGVAFSGGGRSVLLLVVVANWPGQPNPPAPTIDKIISSLRPAGN